MKLYCVKILNNDEIVDVLHMIGNNHKGIQKRIDNFLEDCKKFNLQDEYNGYRFQEVNLVDGIRIDEIFSNYEVVDNKTIKRKEDLINEFYKE